MMILLGFKTAAHWSQDTPKITMLQYHYPQPGEQKQLITLQVITHGIHDNAIFLA